MTLRLEGRSVSGDRFVKPTPGALLPRPDGFAFTPFEQWRSLSTWAESRGHPPNRQFQHPTVPAKTVCCPLDFMVALQVAPNFIASPSCI